MLQIQEEPQLEEGRSGDEEEAQIAQENQILQVRMFFLSFQKSDEYLFHVSSLPFHFQMLSGKQHGTEVYQYEAQHVKKQEMCLS